MGITQASIKQGNEFVFAQQVVDYLQLAFPGWPWTASVDGGVLYVKLEGISGNFGIQCPADKVDKKGVINYGGELLERFNLPYTYNPTALEDVETDFTGKPVSDKWTPDRRLYNENEKRWKA